MVLETQPGFYIGTLFIYYYGVVYALAALSLYLVLLAKRKKLDLNDAQVDTFLISTLLGLIIGARIFHFLINEPSVFISNPLQLFFVRDGGMSFFGAALGVILGTWIWFKKNKVKRETFLKLLDYGSIVVSIALIFGRLANFLNQELVGRIVSDTSVVTWCVEFATTVGCRHPYQLYAAASHVVLAIIVLVVLLRTKKAGLGIATFFTVYGALRFVTDFWREDAIVFIGLTIWQIFALLVTFAGAYWLYRITCNNLKENTNITNTKVKK